MADYRILAINPGSTSTKIAIFSNAECVFKQSLEHSSQELKAFTQVIDQFAFRLDIIRQALVTANIPLESLDAVVGRGGLLRPIESGVYEVNSTMIGELKAASRGQHASNLGALLADALAREATEIRKKPVKAFIADPVVVDELEDRARLTGLPQCERRSVFHALNHKAIAREYALREGKRYEDLNLVVAHMGGGVSVGAHCKGRVIDVNNALDGEGPFSPERAGTLPTGQLVSMCFSGKYTEAEIRKLINGAGGLVAHLGSNDARVMEKAAQEGDARAALVQSAFAYGVSKWIGAMATAMAGRVDAILLTGGMAHSKLLVKTISDAVSFIAPVSVFPGEDEMAALAGNARRVLTGETKPRVY